MTAICRLLWSLSQIYSFPFFYNVSVYLSTWHYFLFPLRRKDIHQQHFPLFYYAFSLFALAIKPNTNSSTYILTWIFNKKEEHLGSCLMIMQKPFRKFIFLFVKKLFEMFPMQNLLHCLPPKLPNTAQSPIPTRTIFFSPILI